MNTMLIGIGVILVLVILAGIFFMSKRRQSGGSAPTAIANRPKTLAEQQLEMSQQRQPSVAAQTPAAVLPSAEEELAKSQQYFAEQDYTSAATTLKQAIKNHPHRGDLQVQLLNVFAQTKNYDNFNRLYPQVLKLNDPTTTQQANNLKNLMDEELAFSQQPQPAASTIAPVAATTVAAATAAQAADSVDFDFFDKAEESLTTSPATPATPVAPATASDELDFDLDFDIPTTTPAATTASTTVTTTPVPNTLTTESDIDFDFDTPTVSEVNTATQPVQKDVVLQDGGELAFDDFALDMQTDTQTDTHTHSANPTPASTNTNSLTTADTQTVDDSLITEAFDFNFDEPAATTQTTDALVTTEPTVTSDENEFDLGDFDIDLPTSNATSPVVPESVAAVAPTATDTVVSSDADMAGFDFNFDEPSLIEANSIEAKSIEATADLSMPVTSVADKTVDDVLFDDFDMNLGLDDDKSSVTATAEPTPTASTTAISDELDMDFDFDSSLSTQTPTSTTEAVPEVVATSTADNEISFEDFDLSLDNEKAVTSTSAPDLSVSPSVPVTAQQDTFDDFEFGDELAVDMPVVQTSVEPTDKVAVAESQNDGSLVDNFVLDDVAINVPTTESVLDVSMPTSAETTPNMATDAGMATTSSPVAATLPEGLENAFDLLKDIDTTQLNVELAEQYVNLGEYDSAKRLLDEISLSAHSQYEGKVQNLLEKIG